jgi:hypothetical protein
VNVDESGGRQQLAGPAPDRREAPAAGARAGAHRRRQPQGTAKVVARVVMELLTVDSASRWHDGAGQFALVLRA